MNYDIQAEIRKIKRTNQLLWLLVAASCAFVTVAWRGSDADVVRAKRFEVIDDQGRVWGTVEKGKIQLSNAAGDSKVSLTSDENNGNLTLTGSGKKRISIFMTDQMPVVALYDSDNRMIATLPPHDR